MILGVCLVVNELHKGQRLVFRYPECIPQYVSHGKYYGLVKLYRQFFALSQDNLARLFRPKNALNHKLLEIAIDDLIFISYPCPCSVPHAADGTNGSTLSSAEHQQSGMHSTKEGAHDSGGSAALELNGDGEEFITMFNVVVVGVSCRAMLRIDPQFAYRCQIFCPSLPGTDPIAAAMGLRGASYAVCKPTLRRIVEAVSSALNHHQKKCGYVTNQVALMLRIMEHYNHPKNSQKASANRATPDVSNVASPSSNSAGGQDAPDQGVKRLTVVFNRNDRSVSNSSGGSTESNSNSGQRPPNPAASVLSNNGEMAVLETSVDGSASRILSPVVSSNNLHRSNSTPDRLFFDASGDVSMTTKLSRGESDGGLIGGDDVSCSWHGSLGSHLTGGVASNQQGVGEHDDDEHKSRGRRFNINVLREMLVRSTLANELRILYHHIVGGHSVIVAFNCVKTANIPLTCKDRIFCEDAWHLRSLLEHRSVEGTCNVVGNYISNCSVMNTPSEMHMYQHSGMLDAAASVDPTNLHLIRILQQQQRQQQLVLLNGQQLPMGRIFRPLSSASLPSGQSSSRASAAVGYQQTDAMSYKGINLKTHTMLTMADTDVILDVLAFLDGRSINAIGGTASAPRSGRQTPTNTSPAGNAAYNSAPNSADRAHKQHHPHYVDSSDNRPSSRNSIGDGSDFLLPEGSSGQAARPPIKTTHYTFGSGGAGGADGSSVNTIRQNSRLYNFLEAADPTQSFLELSLALDEPIEELISMANYLQSWGLAEIVPIIYLQSRYVVHSDAPSGRQTLVGRAFEAFLLHLKVMETPNGASTTPTACISNSTEEVRTSAVKNKQAIVAEKKYEKLHVDVPPSRSLHCSPSSTNRKGFNEIGSGALTESAVSSAVPVRGGTLAVDRYSSTYLLSPSLNRRRVSPYRDEFKPTLRAVKSNEELPNQQQLEVPSGVNRQDLSVSSTGYEKLPNKPSVAKRASTSIAVQSTESRRGENAHSIDYSEARIESNYSLTNAMKSGSSNSSEAGGMFAANAWKNMLGESQDSPVVAEIVGRDSIKATAKGQLHGREYIDGSCNEHSHEAAPVPDVPFTSRFAESKDALSERQPLLMLDRSENVPEAYALPAILSHFDGKHTVDTIINMLPQNLRDFTIDIIVFLLRWHLLVRVESYIVNTQRILGKGSQQEQTKCSTVQDQVPGLFPALDAEMLKQQRQNDENIGSTVSDICRLLSPADARIYDRIAAHVHYSAVSSKTTAEIALLAGITEMELQRMMSCIPHMTIISRLSA